MRSSALVCATSGKARWLVGAAAIMLATTAHAQTAAGGSQPKPEGQTAAGSAAPGTPEAEAPETAIVVTGSRVITNGNQAPTPLTVLSAQTLTETTPSNLPDALNKLPQFASGPAVRNTGPASSNPTGNYLNLRQFGSQRNLILLDGNRVPPTAATGQVDVNLLPQGLIQRVEIVTGGASAVYGSDAITGVINFIIDKNFNGLKLNAQTGISTYGDDAHWRFGATAGTRLFGGRGQNEATFDHYHSNGVIGMESRPEGLGAYAATGAGTAANPFTLSANARVSSIAAGGLIVATPGRGALPPALQNIRFDVNGQPVPFVHGTPTGTAGIEVGGDGFIVTDSAIAAPLTTNQAFARFDYDVTDKIKFYLQGSYNDSLSSFPFIGARLQGAIFSGNPYLPASIQQIMTQTNTPVISIATVTRGLEGYAPRTTRSFSTDIFAQTGLQGTLFGDFHWDLNYAYSRSTQKVSNLNNTSNSKLAASLDAVVDPATGKIVCAVSLTSFASQFPGCVPTNPFGARSISAAAFDYFSVDTFFKLTNTMHDANFSVRGSPLSTWAGPVRVAVSGEYRWLSLRNVTNAEPTVPPNCTGLRTTPYCTATTPPYVSNIAASMFAKQHVGEIAGEVLIPLLKDVPLVRSLELNLAGRYTNYSTSGAVKTWKVGATWQVTEDLRFRGSISRDIRAPTLLDLFSPTQIVGTQFFDLHTNQLLPLFRFISRGNPNLVPEVAKTKTLGMVFQPHWIPRLSLAVDYYEINMANAIVNVAANDIAVQRECEASNGASPFCGLFDRPLGFSDRTAGNFPTAAYSEGLNAARRWTRGVDVEANYRFPMGPGNVTVRGLVSYQPILRSQTIPSSPVIQAAGVAGLSKVRANLFAGYDDKHFRFSVVERWQSSQYFSDPTTNVDLRGKIPPYAYTDISMSYRAPVNGYEIELFTTVENLFNKRPPISGSLNPNLTFPSPPGYDVIGRYFTAGVRARF